MYFDFANFKADAISELVTALEARVQSLTEGREAIPEVLEKMLVEAREVQQMRIELDSMGDHLCDGCTI